MGEVKDWRLVGLVSWPKGRVWGAAHLLAPSAERDGLAEMGRSGAGDALGTRWGTIYRAPTAGHL